MKKTYVRILLVLTFAIVLSSIAYGYTNNSSYISSYNLSLNNSDNETSYSGMSNTYKVFVDGYHGFYRVYDVKSGDELIGSEYEDKTLYIRVNDTVIWANEDVTESFTILSNPKLWVDKAGYLNPAKRFGYKFSQTGIYDIYIRQRQSLPHQTIIVDSLDKSYNQTTISKHEENKTVARNKKVPINDTTSKSRVVIKKYVKSKNTPGFDNIAMILTIIIIIYMSARKRE